MGRAFDIVPSSLDIPRGYFEAAVTDGLLGAWFMGRDLEQSIRNRVRGGEDGMLTGAPVVNDFDLELDGGSKFIDLPFPDPVTGTYVYVGKSNDTHASNGTRPVYMGTAGQSSGATLYTPGSTADRLTVYYTPSGGGSITAVEEDNTPASGLTSYRLMICTFSADGPIALYNMTDGDVSTDTLPAGATRAPGTHVVIGAGPGSSYGGKSKACFASVYQKALDAGERNAVTAQLRAFYGRRGITI